MNVPSRASTVVTGVAVVGYVLLWLFGDGLDTWLLQVAVVGLGYPFLLGTSGRVWDFVDDQLNDDEGDDEDDGPNRDVGLVVGKSENVLILTFMVVGAYTALAVIFAAKSIVRRDDMQNNSKYYLAGTMTNVTYSVLVGVGVRVLLQAFGAWPIAFLSAG